MIVNLLNGAEFVLWALFVVLCVLSIYLFSVSRTSGSAFTGIVAIVCLIFAGYLYVWTGTHFYVKPSNVAVVEDFNNGTFTAVTSPGIQTKSLTSNVHTFPRSIQVSDLDIRVTDENQLPIVLGITSRWMINTNNSDNIVQIFRNYVDTTGLTNAVNQAITSIITETFQGMGIGTIELASTGELIEDADGNISPSISTLTLMREEFFEALTDTNGRLARIGVVVDDIILSPPDLDDAQVARLTARFEREQENLANLESAQGTTGLTLEEANRNAEATRIAAQAQADAQALENERLLSQAGAQATATAIAVQSDANRILSIGNAEGQALQLQGEQLQLYPELIQYQYAQNYGGDVPDVILGDNGYGSVPFMFNMSLPSEVSTPVPVEQ